MKTLFFSVAFFELLASSIGNPSAPALLDEGFIIPDTSWSHLQMGIIGDYLITKKMRASQGSKDLHIQKGELSGTSELATFTWNIREKLNIQMQAGSGQFSWRWTQGGKVIQGHSSGGVVWSGDAKIVVIATNETSFAADFQAGGWDFMSGSSTIDTTLNAFKTKSISRYWQMGFAITQNIGIFAPYLGYAVNSSRFKISDLPTGTVSLLARHKSGAFGGLSLTNGNRFLASFEWRGFFEEGVSLSAQIRF